MKYSVFRDASLVAYVTTEEDPSHFGVFRAGQSEPIAPLRDGRVDVFLPVHESLFVDLAEKDLEGLLFGLKLEEFQLHEGHLAPTIAHRRF